MPIEKSPLEALASRLGAAGSDYLCLSDPVRMHAMRKLAHLIYGVVKSGKPFGINIALAGIAIQDGI